LKKDSSPLVTTGSTNSNLGEASAVNFDFGNIEVNVNIDKVSSDTDLKELEKIVEKTVLNTLTAKVATNVTRKF
jgi:hypothetical protein